MFKQQKFNGRTIESLLDKVAITYLLASVIPSLILLLFYLRETIVSPNSYKFSRTGYPVALIIQGFVVWIALRAGAEIIRLLKKQNGIPYEGEISNEQEAELKCEPCGAPASPEANYCYNCGSQFEEEEERVDV